MQINEVVINPIVNALAEHGYAICDEFLPKHITLALADEVKKRYMAQKMTPAKIGKTHNNLNQSIRGDAISWLDETDSNPAIETYFAHMLTLKAALNQHLYMNLQSLETHMALYPIGAHYQKHIDQFNQGQQSQQARQLSSILYLNEHWGAHDGGELRLYINDNNHIDIAPTAGKLVVFLSAKFWHEVLPAKRQRMSVTGWFRTREHDVF